jgi:hypothetical protein
MNPEIAKLLAKMNQMVGVRNQGKLAHEATPSKKIRVKYVLTSKQKRAMERESKKHRKMEARSRKINRLRGV